MVGNPLFTAARAVLLLACTFSLAGCAADRGRNRPAARQIVPLTGQATLLDGALRAEVRFGPMHFDAEETEALKLPGNLHGNARIAGHNGDIRPSGGLGFSMGGAGGLGGGGRGERRESSAQSGDERPRRNAGRPAGGAPLALISLRFTNHGSTPLKFRVSDFRSVLGNFVVQPEVFELAPGASVEAAPLATQLGAGLAGVDLQLEVKTATGPHRTVIELRPAAAPAAR